MNVNCPVCGCRVKTGQNCPECDYDISTDYEDYKTFSYMDNGLASIRKQREKYKQKEFGKYFIHYMAEYSQQIEARISGLEKEIKQLRLGVSDNRRKQFRNISEGDIVSFGRYPYDKNGAERPIDWIVLKKENQRAMLLSLYALDCQQYNTEFESITWELCSLRKWLNSEFINAAFTDNEQEKIVTVTVPAEKNPQYTTDPGRDTRDRIFLLSIAEAYEYSEYNATRRCPPTDYAIAQGTYQSVEDKTEEDMAACLWWLRSPSCSSNSAPRMSMMMVRSATTATM